MAWTLERAERRDGCTGNRFTREPRKRAWKTLEAWKREEYTAWRERGIHIPVFRYISGKERREKECPRPGNVHWKA
ncbi:hypothetical protein E2C01_096146 [Portunus trituberculatus]|uniref:Uncharacterized protein n=1 Tax=Portunus trituberculatus TaxID=210409 RepID=A0A5B7K5U7_PORTR|nr:hypothetical protein [Portunus trituberculatus]